ncbi:hypothetical protein LCGC14_0643570 [marine sediment metagenome]|uniref:Right handed beta helix domain-containing protein n=1 Tax=marine sediment metagenome TaxID=412755 RepID=A0A0F9TK57_9ZZZZ
MTISASMVLNVRPGGSDNNGGGYHSGAGVDYSTQDSSQYNGVDLTVDGSDNTKVVPDGHTPVGNDLNNLVQITAGAGFTLEVFEILAQDGTSWTLDRSPAATSTSGGTWFMGGGYATPGKAGAEAKLSGQSINVKSGAAYVLSTSTPGPGGPVVLEADKAILLEGYETTPGDMGVKPVIDAGAITGIVLVSGRGGFAAKTPWIVNLKADGNGQTNVDGFRVTDVTDHIMITHCDAVDCIKGFNLGGLFFNCFALTCTHGFYDIAQAAGCEAKDCVTTGFFDVGSGTARFFGCLAYGTSAGKGFQMNYYSSAFRCAAYGCSGDGFDSSAYDELLMMNCLSVGNGGWGFNNGTEDDALTLGCAAYNNTSGNYRATLRKVIGNISLSGDPFVDAAGDDFRLNNVAGAGAACRAAGIGLPQQIGNTDIGATQHADPAGGVSIVGTRRNTLIGR